MQRTCPSWWRWTVLALLCLLSSGYTIAGYSNDEDPRETLLDPGDIFLPGPVCEVDDGDGSCPGVPSLRVPNAQSFDLDAFAIDDPLPVCPGEPWPEGILFSFDDGDPGPGSGSPDHFTEIFYYDHCLDWGPVRQSYYTSITEVGLGLTNDPPPITEDDDVDAYETRPVPPYWDQGINLLFSPDSPSNGGLVPGNVYHINMFMMAPLIWATPANLGVPDPENCDIDGIAPIYDPDNERWMLLFTTDANAPCGLDPGDIYVSDLVGNNWLYADDVTDMKIAPNESVTVDIDALAINTGGDFEIFEPYEPRDPSFYKGDWPNYAPSGMPDFSQDHAGLPSGNCCGPTAVGDSLWWFDSELECDRDRQNGDALESEPNDNCGQADTLAETPAIPGQLIAAGDMDWYTFTVPYVLRVPQCTVTISTCALRQVGDADTLLDLFGYCSPGGVPGQWIATDDNGCPGTFQSEITVQLEGGRYWVAVSSGPVGTGGNYTLSLGIDCFRMVEKYPEKPDDHSEHNVLPLLNDLYACMNTDDHRGAGAWLGTRIADMQTCIDNWLVNKGLDDQFAEVTVMAPLFSEVEEEIERSEDVVLLLGFYWTPDGGVTWNRCGGHYVTSAGVDSDNKTITVSDPALNNAEPPNSAPGRVRGPSHIDHAPAFTPPPDHDDAQNISHDNYAIGPSMLGLPTASWAIPSYATAGGPTTCFDVGRWCMGSDWGQNPHPSAPQTPCPNLALPVSTEVEGMVDVSPDMTAVCIYLDAAGSWPDNLKVKKKPCPAPGATAVAYDVIRGKLCNLQFKAMVAQVDLGYVQCLYDDTALDEFDELSPDVTECFGSWFYLIRQSSDSDYGTASSGETRHPGSGGCP